MDSGEQASVESETYPKPKPICLTWALYFLRLESQHPRQARQIENKEAQILGIWNDLKVNDIRLIQEIAREITHCYFI